MNVLVIDVGGSHVKIMVTGQEGERRLDSGPTLTAAQMSSGVRKLAEGWKYDRVSIGYPGVVVHNHPRTEPHNLGGGWVGFDYEAAFGRPVRIVNDAAMQALGSYEGGAMLFLGLGTGLGSALVVDGTLVPLELARLPYRKGEMEDYVGLRGLRTYGKRRWRRLVAEVVAALRSALVVDYVVLGGGNARHLKELPEGSRLGANALARAGGERLWTAEPSDAARRRSSRRAQGKRSSTAPELALDALRANLASTPRV